MSTDRRHIEPLLAKHFPSMVGKSSDDWHGFLNATTGLDVAPDTSNAYAFDEWRQALAKQGYEGVWPYTPADIERMKARGEELLRLENERKEKAAKEGRW